ncbi:MAG: UbiA prenyltransferase (Modular protein) [Thermotoga sp. 50_1627]|nr:MAG: UbiA prenyltransferase (Modular protein) [Thermotoga sp. 50_64]KUK25992.1 MAG: UbiA prenyltransferase (Modular protein) [Thermotoga sp. 50_1627]MDK2922681.1 hypothetical protein [Pseudothermotoga sp.]
MAIEVGLKFLACIVVYLSLNVFYTFRGKHLVLIDVFCIAAGFALRVMGGSYAIRVSPSDWLIIGTFFPSLFKIQQEKGRTRISGSKQSCSATNPAVLLPLCCVGRIREEELFRKTWFWMIAFVVMNFLMGCAREIRLFLPMMVYVFPVFWSGVKLLYNQFEK